MKILFPKETIFIFFTKDSFGAYFPEKPTIQVQNNDNVYSSNGINGSRQLLVVRANSPYKPNNTAEQDLDMGVFTRDAQATVSTTDSTATTFNGLPAIDYTAYDKATKVHIVGRDIIKDNYVYGFEYYYYPGEKEDKLLENTFFNSLVFGEQPDGSIDLGSKQPDLQQTQIDALKKKVETLQNTKPQTIIKEVPAPTPPPTPTPLSLADIIKQWRLRAVYIECTWRYTDGQIYLQASGSGLAMQYSDGQISFVTNKHVLSDAQDYGPTQCLSKLPDDDTIYTTTFENDKVSTDGSDWGLININDPDSHLKELVNTDFNYCTTEASIGDSVVILGYPSYGTGYSNITATEGIISGYDGQYYTTSAKIEHGNSGGLAIKEKDNCYLGIPTAVVTGGFESLGRILDVKNIFK